MAKGLPTVRIENLRPSIYGRSVDDYFLTTTVNGDFLATTVTTTLNDYFHKAITFSLMLKTVLLRRFQSKSQVKDRTSRPLSAAPVVVESPRKSSSESNFPLCRISLLG